MIVDILSKYEEYEENTPQIDKYIISENERKQSTSKEKPSPHISSEARNRQEYQPGLKVNFTRRNFINI